MMNFEDMNYKRIMKRATFEQLTNTTKSWEFARHRVVRRHIFLLCEQ